MNAAKAKLAAAQKSTGSLLSVGLEPSPEYAGSFFPKTTDGYLDFLRAIIDGTKGHVCAYKLNLAFFESLGTAGWDLLFEVRELIPDEALLIADAKRGDIGSTARHYAKALYEELGADAATVNPLMGTDSAAPFLDHEDKLTFFLALTSNPGADDFLLRDSLFERIAEKAVDWNDADNCGLVCGATRPEHLVRVREIAPTLPILIPGLGAQGGDLHTTLATGRMEGEFSGIVLHVTRGILPDDSDDGSPEEIIHRKTIEWNRRIDKARI